MSRSVLIVDDEADVRSIAQIGIEMGSNWQVITAESGREALTLAEYHQPDVILLDMMMPDLDGRATLQSLKANPMTQAIPVILMTAKARSNHSSGFDELDVVAVFAKPFRPLQLSAQIRETLGWNETP